MIQPCEVLQKQKTFSISLLEQSDDSSAIQRKPYPDCYQIVWIKEGAAACKTDRHPNDVKKSKLFFIRPGQHHHIPNEPGLNGCVISFTNSFLELEDAHMDVTSYNTLFQLLNQAEGIVLNPNLLVEFQEIVDRMQKEYNDNHVFSTEILQRYLKIFLLYLTRYFEDHFLVTHQTRNMELVQQFMSLLDKRFKTQKMVAAYARELYVTPNYLNEIIKKTTGFSAGYHIRQRIVLEAKRLAWYSNLCMKEIAYSLDFADSAHFSKFFKTVTGSNFSDFKKEKLTLTIAG